MIFNLLHRFLFEFHKRTFLFVIFLCFLNTVCAQEEINFNIPDSLQKSTYETLKKAFSENVKNPQTRIVLARTYLAKAIAENDTLRMAKGYQFLGVAHKADYRKSFTFYDKGIALSENLNDTYYPAILYTYKGAVSYLEGNYKEALENHLKAIEYSEANDNVELLYVNKYNIGILKKRLELYEEALSIFKECYIYELNDPNRDSLNFLNSHLTLADVYTEMKQLDSASKYNEKGMKLAIQTKNIMIQNLLLLNKGVILFYRGKFQATIDTIELSLKKATLFPNKISIMDGYFHLGKAYDSLQNKAKAIANYNKVDSIFTKNPKYISSSVMENYEALYTYYRSQGDKANEALYIKKALFAASQSKKDYRTLSVNIAKKYDRRELLSKQKRLDTELKQKNKQYNTTMIIATFIFGLFVIIFIGFYLKQKRLRKLFKEFVKKHEEKSLLKEKVTHTNITEDIGVPNDIIQNLLEQLAVFETQETFIETDITLTSMAKRFKTNSAYLSKTINTYKDKNFAEYLNDLRVDYAIDKLQNDKRFSLYTIKAIALEVGFNNSQSFARAFKRKTNMQPSDFIKQIKISKY